MEPLKVIKRFEAGLINKAVKVEWSVATMP
jgi:hypothetical protein